MKVKVIASKEKCSFKNLINQTFHTIVLKMPIKSVTLNLFQGLLLY